VREGVEGWGMEGVGFRYSIDAILVHSFAVSKAVLGRVVDDSE